MAPAVAFRVASPELAPLFCFCFVGSLCFPLPRQKDNFLMGSQFQPSFKGSSEGPVLSLGILAAGLQNWMTLVKLGGLFVVDVFVEQCLGDSSLAQLFHNLPGKAVHVSSKDTYVRVTPRWSTFGIQEFVHASPKNPLSGRMSKDLLNELLRGMYLGGNHLTGWLGHAFWDGTRFRNHERLDSNRHVKPPESG